MKKSKQIFDNFQIRYIQIHELPRTLDIVSKTEVSVILEKSNDLNLSKGKVNTGEQTYPSTLANSTTTRLKGLVS